MDPTTLQLMMSSARAQWIYPTGPNSLPTIFGTTMAFSATWTGQNYVTCGGSSVGLSATGGKVAISSNGFDWSIPASSVAQVISKHAVTNNGSGIVVMTQSNTNFLRSTDHGATWSVVAEVPVGAYTLYWDGTYFCNPPVSPSTTVKRSTDGLTWVSEAIGPTSGDTYGMLKVGSNYFYVVRQTGVEARIFRGDVASGSGAAVQVAQTTGYLGGYLSSLATDGNGTIVAVGQSTNLGGVGLSMYSKDNGVTWTQNTSFQLSNRLAGSINGESHMVYDGTQFFVVCRGGVAIRSTDGINWVDDPGLAATTWGPATVGYAAVYNPNTYQYLVFGGITGTGAQAAIYT